MAEKTAKVILREMHGKDFSEYGFQDACIKAEMQLQNAEKDKSYLKWIHQLEGTCEIYEIKHSKEVVPQQCKHLLDEQKCKDTEFRYGTITG